MKQFRMIKYNLLKNKNHNLIQIFTKLQCGSSLLHGIKYVTYLILKRFVHLIFSTVLEIFHAFLMSMQLCVIKLR